MTVDFILHVVIILLAARFLTNSCHVIAVDSTLCRKHHSLSQLWQHVVLVCHADNYRSFTAVRRCSGHSSRPGIRIQWQRSTSSWKSRVVPAPKQWGGHLAGRQRPWTGDQTFEVDHQEDYVGWQHLRPVRRRDRPQRNSRGAHKATSFFKVVVCWIREERAQRWTRLLYLILTGIPYRRFLIHSVLVSRGENSSSFRVADLLRTMSLAAFHFLIGLSDRLTYERGFLLGLSAPVLNQFLAV